MSLKVYQRKRKFDRTPEPSATSKRSARRKGPLRFVVQKHDATRTHYDFRLELDGTLKSWAVPKGPSLRSQDPRLALQVEDHPLEYGSFEGVIPKGNYGAGTVMVWDEGTYLERGSRGRADSERALRRALADGHLTFLLEGKKLRGEFALVRLKKKGAPENGWLLIKKHDAEASRADVTREDRSVASGRTMKEIAEEAESKGEIWLPRKGRAARLPRAPAPSTMPRRVRPMEPVFAAKAPKEAGWIFERYGAGYRALAEVEPGRVRLHSRALLPFEKKFPKLVEALRGLGHRVLLDGEIVREGTRDVFEVSDLLFLDGKDLRGLSLRSRKDRLARLMLRLPLRHAPWKESEAEIPARARGTLVAKRANSLYRSGLTRDWVRFRPGANRTSAGRAADRPPLTHLSKIYWPEEGYTKGDLVRYYESVADTILPHLVDRPQSLHRQPDGIRNEGFFHKDMQSYLPRRMQTIRIESGSSGRTINYVLCQNRWDLLYLANLGCIELNPWLSRRGHLDRPDFSVIDLDPDENPFDEVVEVAQVVHEVLAAIGAEGWCKTSGASGLHVCVPTGGRYDYEVSRKFAEAVCRVVHLQLPRNTSLERSPARRRHKIYLDFLQNRRSQTLAAPYCVRPRPGAPVSAPLKWGEVKAGLQPGAFTIETMGRRIARLGDLWRPLLDSRVDLEACMKRLSKRYHI